MTERVVVRGRLVTPDEEIADGVVECEAAEIVRVAPAQVWRQTHGGPLPDPVGTVLPGLVDVHCHGGGGHSVGSTDPDEVRAVAAHHAQAGTTRMVASLVTASAEVLLEQVEALAPLVWSGEIAGIHLEGPFLSERRCGAQAPEFLVPPDPALVEKLLQVAGGAITAMTVAPELPGYDEVAALLRANGIVVALGHSDATYDTFRSALRGLDGAGLVTHLANGMPPLHHRAAGPVGAALAEAAGGHATVEVIADGVHVDDGFAALVFASAGPDSVVLVTDAMAAAGMPDGDYVLGPQAVSVRDGVARLRGSGPDAEPPSIAGGTSHLLEIVTRVVRTAEVPLDAAVRAASSTPARVIGEENRIGSLAPGRVADLVVVDDELRVRRVLRDGRWLT